MPKQNNEHEVAPARMATEKFDAANLGFRRYFLVIPIVLELSYFFASQEKIPPLCAAIIGFPLLFVLPGVMLLLVLKRNILDVVKLFVEGFFVSTLILVILTAIMSHFQLPIVPSTYSIVMLCLVLGATAFSVNRRVKLRFRKCDLLLLSLAFLTYVVLILYFNGLPRFFTPDESSYISSARMVLLEGQAPAMGAGPGSSGIIALMQGRYFWIYLLASFIGSTGLQPSQAGLLNVGFLVLTGLVSSLLLRLVVKDKWLGTFAFLIVVSNSLLLSFSALALNDLSISFYLVLAVFFFVGSFSNMDGKVTLRCTNLLYCLLILVTASLIKLNLLVAGVMWLILVYVLFRHRLYRTVKFRILSIAILLPVLAYELFIDSPYVVAEWIFRNESVASLFRGFLPMSPIETFLRVFFVPWWHPVASVTILTQPIVGYMDHLYRLLMPESSSLLISATILVLPILLLANRAHLGMLRKPRTTTLILVTVFSMWFFYFDVVGTGWLTDTARYSLWMVALWVPVALIFLKNALNKPSFSEFLPMIIGALILIWINTWLTREKGGVYVGYVLPYRIQTADAILLEFVILGVLGFLYLKKNAILTIFRQLHLPSLATKTSARSFAFPLVMIIILANILFLGPLLLSNNTLYEDSGITLTNETLSNLAGSNLVFVNNYVYVKPYASDSSFEKGSFLPFPDTKTEFLSLLGVCPNNTLMLISNDKYTTGYDYSNQYIQNYTAAGIITPETPLHLQNPSFSAAVLKMSFDDVNQTTVVDQSGYGNNGMNHGARPVEGVYGKALQFEGNEYVSVGNQSSLNFNDSITISFFANITKLTDSMILSKGYAVQNGSYHVFIYNDRLYFGLALGLGQELSIPVDSYFDNWHNFILTYDGEQMSVFVDGSLVASKLAHGPIRASPYDLEIGRDSERKRLYFVGSIDELEISNKPLNLVELKENTYACYALPIGKLQLPEGEANLFCIINQNVMSSQTSVVKSLVVHINDHTFTLDTQVESQVSKNITILVSTDRFTKVLVTNLKPGVNNLKFQYNSDLNASYWPYLAQARVIVIDGSREIYNKFIFTPDPISMNALLLFILVGNLAVYAILAAFAHRDRERRDLDARAMKKIEWTGYLTKANSKETTKI